MNKLSPVQATITPRIDIIFTSLVSIALFLIICSVAVNASIAYEFIENEKTSNKLKQFFDLNKEYNLPTVFSFLLLLSSSLLVYIVSRLHKAKGSLDAFLWGLLSFIFFCLAFDEILMIHERVASIFGKTIDVTSSTRYFLWVIPYSIPLLYLAYRFFPFLFRLPYRHRRNFILAASLYVGGGYFIEILGGWHQAVYGNGFIHSLIYTLEEGLEMMGLIFFIKSLFLYWKTEIGNANLTFLVASTSDEQPLSKDRELVS